MARNCGCGEIFLHYALVDVNDRRPYPRNAHGVAGVRAYLRGGDLYAAETREFSFSPISRRASDYKVITVYEGLIVGALKEGRLGGLSSEDIVNIRVEEDDCLLYIRHG